MKRVRFIRNFVLEPIQYWIDRELRGSGLSVTYEFGDYAGSANEISALPGENDLTVLALGLEMSSPEFGHFDWDAEGACSRHLALVRHAVERSGSLLVNTVLPPLYDALGGANHVSRRNADACVDELNAELRRLVNMHPTRVTLCDWGRIARQLGHKSTYDQRFWRSSAAPFAGAFLAEYAKAIAGALRVRAGKVRKCLVLDCDNTLWGGIVGEDGLSGIQLSEDTLPGGYFREFQRSIIDLQRRGVLIALASKNNASDVWEVLEKHPACLLRREHIAAWRVDWNDKTASIAAIAGELNIDLDAMVFVDDSEVECELATQAFPTLRVLRVPDSPVELVGFLERAQVFEALNITTADAQRTRTYQESRERRLAYVDLPDSQALKHSLQTRLVVRPAHESDSSRIVQLIQRTNQFNLTTRRHQPEALQAMFDSDEYQILCAEMSDRFGDLGLIGVAIVRRKDVDVAIDTLLMSCRALGREAEFAFVCGIYNFIQARWSPRFLHAQYLPTARNVQTADFWDRVGMQRENVSEDGAVSYLTVGELLDCASELCPSHVTLEIAI